MTLVMGINQDGSLKNEVILYYIESVKMCLGGPNILIFMISIIISVRYDVINFDFHGMSRVSHGIEQAYYFVLKLIIVSDIYLYQTF